MLHCKIIVKATTSRLWQILASTLYAGILHYLISSTTPRLLFHFTVEKKRLRKVKYGQTPIQQPQIQT